MTTTVLLLIYIFFQSAYTIRDRFDINEKVVDASVHTSLTFGAFALV